jgi:membrane-bound metal-dependent hydrolase YbcI (DUF457 family)
MKGITHFCTGIAVASCFPYAIEIASLGNPICFIIAGIMSLIPDTIDFKLLCFLKHIDCRIVPEHENFNPQLIADEIANFVELSHETNRRKDLRLCSIRSSPDKWFEYSVTFKGQQIIVQENGNKQESKRGVASAALPFHCKYESTMTATIFVGPTITMTPKAHHTQVDFIDWHRGCTHSFMMAIVLSIIAAIVFNTTVGIIAFTAYSSHILLDQIGHMGSSIFWPFNKRKINGCSMCHSDSRFANIFTVTLSILIIFANSFYFQYPTQLLDAVRIVLIPTIIILLYKKIKMKITEDN